MTNSVYRNLINKIVQACQQKDAERFASVFADSAQIQLDSQTTIDGSQIFSITDEYFKQLEFIKIEVLAIAINEEQQIAFIEWVWSDFNTVKNKESSHQNTIVLEFKNDLVYCWREYKI